MWIWPQVASRDLRLHAGFHFCCNERLRLGTLNRSNNCTSVATKGQENCGAQNRSNVEQKQQNTDHTRPESSGQGQEKTKKRRLGALNVHQKRARNAFRAASKVLRRSRALLECLWRRLGPLPRGLGEAPGTSRGALGRVLGSFRGVSETISGVFSTSEEVA